MKRTLILALALLLALAPAAEAKKKKKKPLRVPVNQAKFYNPPAKLIRGMDGTVIWQKGIVGHPKLAAAKVNRVMLYRSTSVRGKKVAVSGTVHIPKGRAPRGGWPIISWAHGTTGTADLCAPSVERGNLAIEYGGGAALEGLLNSWLRKGYAVVRTDYEGLGTPGPHPYLVGESAGRSVLDMVRAAKAYGKKARLPLSNKFFIIGHSQGGHAALWAAKMKNQVVPGLDLRGTISYAPASHLKEQANLLAAATETSPLFGQPSSLTALATLIVQGAKVQDPSLDLNTILSDPVKAYLPETNKKCLPQLGASNMLGGIAPYQMINKGANIDPLLSVLDSNQPVFPLTTPLLMVQGDADTTVNPLLSGLLANNFYALAPQFTYNVYPGADHSSILAAANSDVSSFLDSKK